MRFSKICRCFKSRQPDYPSEREVRVSSAGYLISENYSYPDNRVITSHFTIYNFLPLNLFYQFHRVANIYFLICGILALFVADVVQSFTAILPLILVVSSAIIKSGYEDYLRHKVDKKENCILVNILKDFNMHSIESKEVKVGTFVVCSDNEIIPCDMIVLATSKDDGTCFVNTASIDGESNLKVKYAANLTKSWIKIHKIPKSAFIEMTYEQPTANLYNFSGHLKYITKETLTNALSDKNLLLKGMRLKSTANVIGLAVYTGKDTKISLNKTKKLKKVSIVDLKSDKFLLFIFIILFLMVMCCTICTVTIGYQNKAWYLPLPTKYSFKYYIYFSLAFFIIFSSFIPLSLYTTVEMLKFIGAQFINWDVHMCDHVKDGKLIKPAKANTSDINEQLSQVQYLFSDKTGTITENIMQFRACSVGEIIYEEITPGELKPLQKHSNNMSKISQTQTDNLDKLLIAMALCHTVQVGQTNQEKSTLDENEDSFYEQINREKKAEVHFQSPRKSNLFGELFTYEASSPEEKAAVKACSRFGIVFQGMKNFNYSLSIHDETVQYEQLHIIEFDSERKCMSVIVRTPDHNIFLYCKGAETAIIERVSSNVSQREIKTLLANVSKLCKFGLRTLVYAFRHLTKKEYQEFLDLVHKADYAGAKRDRMMHDAFIKVEKDLEIIGCMGVEDKIQEGVFETLTALRAARIQVWILTGDKEETAVNISLTCGHMESSMTKISVTQHTDEEECMNNVLTQLKFVCDQTMKINSKNTFALIVDGMSLAIVLRSSKIKKNFLMLCLSSSAVLCCRMSPLQKAEVVKMVKDQQKYLTKDEILTCIRRNFVFKHSSKQKIATSPITASIGDGANDVSMIQEAHIGFGITGREGRAAAQNSDFSFCKFKYLCPILFVHGLFFYTRMVTLIFHYFYKNIVIVLTMLFYVIQNSFSDKTIYNAWLLTFYNVIFTILPITIYAIIEQRFSRKLLLKKPFIYHSFMANNALFTWKVFIKWMMISVYHALVIWFGGIFFNKCIENYAGVSHNTFGNFMFFSVMLIVSAKLAIDTRFWAWLSLLSYILTAIMNAAIIVLLDLIMITGSYREWSLLFSLPPTWITFIWILPTALLPDIFLRVHSEISDVDLLQGPSPDSAMKKKSCCAKFAEKISKWNTFTFSSGKTTKKNTILPQGSTLRSLANGLREYKFRDNKKTKNQIHPNPIIEDASSVNNNPQV